MECTVVTMVHFSVKDYQFYFFSGAIALVVLTAAPQPSRALPVRSLAGRRNAVHTLAVSSVTLRAVAAHHGALHSESVRSIAERHQSLCAVTAYTQSTRALS